MSVVLQVAHHFLADASSQLSSGLNAACGGNSACNNTNVNALFKQITNALIFLIGALSVIMIIFGGIRYVISRGDSAQIAAAKNTIIYAVGGLVVAIASYAIVNFVITNIK